MPKKPTLQERLEVAEMRLRNLFAFTALMALKMPGGCFFCHGDDGAVSGGHADHCDFHSSYWNHPFRTVWAEGDGLPDAWVEGSVCDDCGGTYPDHVGFCSTAFYRYVAQGADTAPSAPAAE